ncbi:iron complex transport system substrate-binding protein [Kibdelosporangium banguiense]|uniref:Iron complex transport system substrate-binding protein n=1 Tax=Kibdelosporangium banguiense TaxID=1365924 RepID=A0ABS4TTH2_9PSEU|nr:iron-siderophore ABC transporter substrate-binding protein [Kibdelosporangium banguiense]MBP2327687.1 iron complex transport system substrate-binding protein [Kibdelosporangium banguiense]
MSPTLARRLPAVLVAGVLTLSIAACGSQPPATSTAQTGSAAQQPAASAFPVTIEHKFGKTEIKTEPRRVVSLGLTDQDAMLALGVRPVGATAWFGEQPYSNWPWADSKWGDARAEVISDGNQVQYEKVAALRPDLIIGQYAQVTQEQYDKLSQIAPVVAQNAKFEDYSTPWREMTTTIGKALGKEAEAKKLIAGTEAKFAEIRKAHPEFEGKKVIVADSPAAGQYGAFAPADPRTVLMTELGFKVDDKLSGQTKDGKPIMFGDERLDLLDTDVLVLMPPDKASIDRVKGTPVYQKLQVATGDRVVYLPYTEPPAGVALTFATVLSIPYALDQMVPALSQAAKKKQ